MFAFASAVFVLQTIAVSSAPDKNSTTTAPPYNLQPDPPLVTKTTGATGTVSTIPCYKNCPDPAHCQLIKPPCGGTPVPTCVCPKGQVWSDCPGCLVSCIELYIKRPCLDVCNPAQCICPDGELFNLKNECVPMAKCPPLVG